ncbi:MAG: NAD-dependent epimerase/dehydratase family protein [Acidimicrobiales bacterium]
MLPPAPLAVSAPTSTRPAEFLYDNMMISASVIEAANRTDRTKKLLYLASSSAYPRNAVQPIHESALLTGALEPTNEGYALAEIIGLKLCETYRKQYARNLSSRSFRPTCTDQTTTSMSLTVV